MYIEMSEIESLRTEIAKLEIARDSGIDSSLFWKIKSDESQLKIDGLKSKLQVKLTEAAKEKINSIWLVVGIRVHDKKIRDDLEKPINVVMFNSEEESLQAKKDRENCSHPFMVCYYVVKAHSG
jgi:hypothetical protein